MDAQQLQELASRLKNDRAFIKNEETTKMALVVPFLRTLGYDPNNPREVRVEYAADFTQADGKRYADRMDFVIFDALGTRPLMAIEVKPLGTAELPAKSQQLARYIAQLRELHFGMITDGERYMFFSDLENPNIMDREPFFEFSLEDARNDWGKIAGFLTKFSRENFNGETLMVDAQNSRYRQAMIAKLEKALKSPGEDEDFLRWLTSDVHEGRRTVPVRVRLAEIAKESVEPALIRILSDEFLTKLRQRMQDAKVERPVVPAVEQVPAAGNGGEGDADKEPRAEVVTSEEELEFYRMVTEICRERGVKAEDIVYGDTVNYFNVSWQRPRNWFLRLICRGARKQVVTLVPVEEATKLVPGIEVEPAPPVFGVSRVYIENVDQTRQLAGLVLRSLEIATATN